MSTTRTSFTALLGFAFIAMLGNTAIAGDAPESCGARRQHATLATAQLSTALTNDYRADRAALLQAALHLNHPTIAELASAHQYPVVASVHVIEADQGQARL